MPNKTGISWTDFTSNPLRYRDGDGKDVWACVHKSDGCTNCYAESMALRLGKGAAFTAQNIKRVEPYLDEREISRLLTSKSLSGKRVFIADMTDLFGEWVHIDLIRQLWTVFEARQDVTWQVLTKRPERMREVLSDPAFQAIVLGHPPNRDEWPLPNVWLGVSAELQRQADERIPLLLQTPAAVRFVSAEPLLGPVDLRAYLGPEFTACQTDGKPETIQAIGQLAKVAAKKYLNAAFLNWVIVGGESGPNVRPMELDWARSVRDQCAAAGVAFWFKQQSGLRPGANPTLDGVEYHQFPQTAWPLVPVPKEQGALL